MRCRVCTEASKGYQGKVVNDIKSINLKTRLPRRDFAEVHRFL
jgi:hypothetical protein